MHSLTSKTPEMVEKELLLAIAGYNLVRSVTDGGGSTGKSGATAAEFLPRPGGDHDCIDTLPIRKGKVESHMIAFEVPMSNGVIQFDLKMSTKTTTGKIALERTKPEP